MTVLNKIDRYEVRSEIGRGGMATVYRAYDPFFQREVAIKVLPRHFLHDPAFAARFASEARLIATLEHNAIVPVYDFGGLDEQPFLVMRLLTGGSLRQRLGQRGPLPLPEIARIMNILAPGLDAAHHKGIIHRDLKPDNILFDEYDAPYLADFGIARLAEATQTMTIIGTPAYMSPEQWTGDLRLDGRVDIYALGIILFEMLTGGRPYPADTPAALMHKHLLSPIPDPLAVKADLPAGCRAVITKAMAKDRERRYQSAAALAQAVDHLVAESQPTTAAIESNPETEVILPDFVARQGDDSQTEKVDAAADLADGPIAALAQDDLTLVDDRFTTGAAPPTVTTPAAATTPATVVRAQRRRRLKRVAVPALILAAILLTGLAFLLGPRLTGRSDSAATPGIAGGFNITPFPERLILPSGVAPGTTAVRPADEMTILYVPAGTFAMGSDQGFGDEQPVHDVAVSAYWLDQTEVTNQQFARFIQATGFVTAAELHGGWIWVDGVWNNTPGADWQHPRGPESDLARRADYPVVLVSRPDAAAYCTWVGGRLPTEAEWEYAARGSTGAAFPWGRTFDGARVNFCDRYCPQRDQADNDFSDGYVFAAPVGSFPAGRSWIGADDLAGNVWEWTADWYAADYYAASPAADPAGPGTGQRAVLRGGGWETVKVGLRTTVRNSSAPERRTDYVGFRCVVPSN